MQKLTTWVHGFIKLLPNILISAIILVVGFFIAKKIRKVAAKLIGKVSPNQTLNNLFSSIVYIFLLGVTYLLF